MFLVNFSYVAFSLWPTPWWSFHLGLGSACCWDSLRLAKSTGLGWSSRSITGTSHHRCGRGRGEIHQTSKMTSDKNMRCVYHLWFWESDLEPEWSISLLNWWVSKSQYCILLQPWPGSMLWFVWHRSVSTQLDPPSLLVVYVLLWWPLDTWQFDGTRIYRVQHKAVRLAKIVYIRFGCETSCLNPYYQAGINKSNTYQFNCILALQPI